MQSKAHGNVNIILSRVLYCRPNFLLSFLAILNVYMCTLKANSEQPLKDTEFLKLVVTALKAIPFVLFAKLFMTNFTSQDHGAP